MANPNTGAGTLDTSNLASLHFDEWIGGGLVDDVDLEIVKARFVPWNYGGAINESQLAVRLTLKGINDDEGVEAFDQFYSAGDLASWAPTNDGVEPAGAGEDEYKSYAAGHATFETEDVNGQQHPAAQYEGVAALRIGRKMTLSPNSNFNHFLEALRTAGFPKEEESYDLRFLEGLQGHFNRLGQKERRGMEGQQQDRAKKRTILLCTDILKRPSQQTKATGGGAKKSAGTTTATAKPAASKANGKPSAADGSDDAAKKIEEAIVRLVADGPVSYIEVRRKTLAEVGSTADNLNYLKDAKWMTSPDRPFFYDKGESEKVALSKEEIDAE